MERQLKKMKSAITLLTLCTVLVSLHASVPSYTWPTFKSNIQSVDTKTNQTTVANFCSDSKKKMIRLDANLINPKGVLQHYIQIFEVDKYTLIDYTVGKDDSIACIFAKLNTSELFGNLLSGATYMGFKTLSSTIGMSYQVPAFFGSPFLIVIDAFTNYPAMLVKQNDNSASYFINASEFSDVESDAMLRIPKGITCKQVAGKVNHKFMILGE